MPALLYGIGVFALFAGLVMIGFGIPINEFSFGNTLIGAGTTASYRRSDYCTVSGWSLGRCGGSPRRWLSSRLPGSGAANRSV